MDNVQHMKNGLGNRSRIKTQQGVGWLTIPISFKFGDLIKDVRVNTIHRKKYLKTLEINYRKAPFFDAYYPLLEEILTSNWDCLADMNIELLKTITGMLSLTTRFVKGSEIGAEGKKMSLVIDMVKKVGGSSYLSGIGAVGYQDKEVFENHGVELVYQRFIHPRYTQLYGDFVEGLSVVDALFNVGADEIVNLLEENHL